ncbi:MAG: putative DNA-binding domain-containing protein [Thermoanaerobaculia bacterium]
MSAPRPLDVVQRWFQAVVSHPEGVGAGASSEEAQGLIRLDRGELEAVVSRSKSLSAAERLSIYANAYHARLLECLEAYYPVLRRALGREVFEGFAFEYLQRYPSKSYTLDRLGEDFARFLEETRPAGADWPDFLIDLATLEWNITRVFDGPGVEFQTLLTPEALQAFPAERFAEARLAPVPCLRVLEFRYPVNAYYTAARRAEEDEEIPLPGPAEEWVALTRRDFVVRRYPLTAPQHALLGAVLEGAPVGEAIAVAAGVTDHDDDAFASDLQSWFRFWTAEGFFQALVNPNRVSPAAGTPPP